MEGLPWRDVGAQEWRSLMRGRVREGLVKGVGVKDLQELFTRHGICRRGKGIDRGLACRPRH